MDINSLSRPPKEMPKYETCPYCGSVYHTNQNLDVKLGSWDYDMYGVSKGYTEFGYTCSEKSDEQCGNCGAIIKKEYDLENISLSLHGPGLFGFNRCWKTTLDICEFSFDDETYVYSKDFPYWQTSYDYDIAAQELKKKRQEEYFRETAWMRVLQEAEERERLKQEAQLQWEREHPEIVAQRKREQEAKKKKYQRQEKIKRAVLICIALIVLCVLFVVYKIYTRDRIEEYSLDLNRTYSNTLQYVGSIHKYTFNITESGIFNMNFDGNSSDKYHNNLYLIKDNDYESVLTMIEFESIPKSESVYLEPGSYQILISGKTVLKRNPTEYQLSTGFTPITKYIQKTEETQNVKLDNWCKADFLDDQEIDSFSFTVTNSDTFTLKFFSDFILGEYIGKCSLKDTYNESVVPDSGKCRISIYSDDYPDFALYEWMSTGNSSSFDMELEPGKYIIKINNFNVRFPGGDYVFKIVHR